MTPTCSNRLVIACTSFYDTINNKATWALLDDFEIFAHFDHIFYLTFSHFSTPQSGYDPVGPKFELQIQVFDQRNTAKQNKMDWQLFLASFVAFKNWKIPIFVVK